MKKFLLGILAFAGISALNAAVLDIGGTQLLPQVISPSANVIPVTASGTPFELKTLTEGECAMALSTDRAFRANVTWSEWKQLCTTSFPEDMMDFLRAICANNNAVMPEFQQPFPVMKRTASDGTSQLCFKNVFNNVDITINIQADGSFTCNEFTGIAIPGAPADWYGEFRLYMSGWYLEGANKLNVESLFWLVYGNMGYSSGDQTEILLGEAPEFTFELKRNEIFVPSSLTQATFEVVRSDNVAFYRVVSNYESTLHKSDVMAMMQYKPDSKYDGIYRDVTGSNFTVEVRNDSDQFYLIPFNAENVAIGNYITATTQHNKPLEGTWRSIGVGTLRDFAVYYIAAMSGDVWNELGDVTAALSTPVEVEVLEGNENIMRFKSPYTSSHPLASYLTTFEEQDDFYLVIDVSDPSRVVMKRRMSGVWNEYNGYVWILSRIESMIESYGYDKEKLDYWGLWGKYADKCVKFPCQSINVEYTLQDERQIFPPYVLELPGYVNYDICVEDLSLNADGSAVATISGISSEVASVSYALVPFQDYEKNRYFLERYVERFSDGADEMATVYTVQTGGASEITVSVPASEVPYGRFHLVAVSRDVQGSSHSASASEKDVSFIAPADKWEDAGSARVKDSSVMAAFTTAPCAEMVVEVKECPGVPGLFLIPDYYLQWAQATGYADFYNADDADMYVINATDLARVFITSNLDGSPVNGPMKTGLNVNPAYSTVCLMNNSDFFPELGHFGNATFRERPDGSVEYVGVDFYQGPLLCAVYDTEGSLLGAREGETSFEFGYDPSEDMTLVENWKKLGEATVTENIALSRISTEKSVFTAELRQHPYDESLYALVDLYKNMNHPTFKDLSYTGSVPLFIKMENPDKVWLSMRYDGSLMGDIVWSSGLMSTTDVEPFWLALMANAIRQGALPDFVESDYYGSFADGEFILDNCLWAYSDANGLTPPAPDATFRVKLPTLGVETVGISCAEDAPVEYYNLQGMRVVAPSSGIFIRRQGSQVSKVYVK